MHRWLVTANSFRAEYRRKTNKGINTVTTRNCRWWSAQFLHKILLFWQSARPPAVRSMCIQTCGETEKLNGAYRWNKRSITKTEIFTKYTLSFHGGHCFIFLLSSTSDIYLLQECHCRHSAREIKLTLLHYPVHPSKYSTEQSEVLNQLVAENVLKFGMIPDKLLMWA